MGNEKLLFYQAYEDYYSMTHQNVIFSDYCEKVFGIDFSQDGFSDTKQVNDLIQAAKIHSGSTVLDIGCGNGKMLEYISDKTGAAAHGFDYSKNAIEYAKQRTQQKSSRLFFSEGVIDEKNYAYEMFDAILSVDTLYFTRDIQGLMLKIYSWLKPGGIFAAFYSEGHMKPHSNGADKTDFSLACKILNISYQAADYTRAHFDLMRHKRQTALDFKQSFEQNGLYDYYEAAIHQSIDTSATFLEFKKKYSRYLYCIIKS